MTDLLELFLLVDAAGLSAQQANVPALLAGALAQFLANKYLAFQDYSRAFLRQGFLYALTEGVTLLLNAVGFQLLVAFTPTPYLLARILVSFVVFALWSFPVWRKIFRPTPAAQRP